MKSNMSFKSRKENVGEIGKSNLGKKSTTQINRFKSQTEIENNSYNTVKCTLNVNI